MIIRLTRALACAMALIVPAGALAGEAPAKVTALHVSESKGGTEITLELSAEVAATARPVADPDRILLDLPEVALSPELTAKPAAGWGGLVSDVRFGALEPGKSRLVLELAHKACVSAFTRAGSGAATKLELQIAPCDAKAFASAATAAPIVSRLAEAPVIVIDPGHGGADGGAHGAKGLAEKTIVFDFASQLKAKLEQSGRYKIVMTRDGDEYVALEDRVQIAKDANAALMISIHADSYPTHSSELAADVYGTTVYTCSDRASDAEAARIAASENASDRAGAPKGDKDNGVADILFDLKRRETRAYAHMFSRGVVSEWRGSGRLNRHPERSAGFFVLKAPDFPSVLVELGYLSNPQDVANMTDPDWRQRGVAAIATAVDRFFAPTSAGGGRFVLAGGCRLAARRGRRAALGRRVGASVSRPTWDASSVWRPTLPRVAAVLSFAVLPVESIVACGRFLTIGLSWVKERP